MKTTQFAVAKYIPDLTRMEPRNCGVILWDGDACIARFVGDERDRDKKDIDRLELVSKDTYFQWIEFWRRKVSQIQPKQDRLCPDKDQTEEFERFLTQNSMENFVLAYAGSFSKHLSAKKMHDALIDLYQSIVATPSGELETPIDQSKKESLILRREVNRAIEESGLSKIEGFKTSFEWLCPVGNTKQRFSFHFAIHRKRPESIFHRVNLSRQQAVNDAAFMFQSMQQSDQVTRAHCGSFVFADKSDLKQQSVKEALKLMKAYSEVINLADHDQAMDKLSKLAI